MQENSLAQKKSEKIRAFFAINPPKETLGIFEKIIKQLCHDKFFKDIKWTTTENLHITLNFLGNISAKQQTQIIEKTEMTLKGMPGFPIICTELSWFLKEKPRLITITPKPADNDNLIELVSLINEQALQCGIPEETHPFFPHITLGRMKKEQHKPLKTAEFPQLPIIKSPIQFTVREIILFRSDPDPDHNTSKYTPIKHFVLT